MLRSPFTERNKKISKGESGERELRGIIHCISIITFGYDYVMNCFHFSLRYYLPVFVLVLFQDHINKRNERVKRGYQSGLFINHLLFHINFSFFFFFILIFLPINY